MNEQDIQLKLLANMPIYIDGIGMLQLPTITEIIKMGESKYNHSLSLMLFTKDYLATQNEEVNNFSDFEVMLSLILYDPSFREMMFNTFSIFINSTPNMTEDGILFFGEPKEESILTEEKWTYIQKIIKLGNYIHGKQEDEYKPGNERARKFIEKQKKNKEMVAKLKKKDETINLHSIISAVAWRTNGFNQLLNLTIYQLYDGFYRLGLIDNYHYTFTGIYTGNIDGSKIKLPDINWANIIKIN